MRILVTGANGFIGSALCSALRTRGWSVREATRKAGAGADSVTVGSIDGHTDWSEALEGCDLVIHLAARVHVMDETHPHPLGAFREVNVEGTLNLAEQAAAVGVKRLVFVSSVKVNGEASEPGTPFTADDPPNPSDPYGISKQEAEAGLRAVAERTGLETVTIRPVLVYGPGVRANFLSMMRWLQRGVPLPLGAIHNRRSLVALDNLVDLIVTCVDHPAAANQTFLVSDGEDLSTSDLLRRLGRALGRPARLLPVPFWLLAAGATLLGKRAVAQRLLGSLQVDIDKTRTLLGWTPPVGVDEALRKTADDQRQLFFPVNDN